VSAERNAYMREWNRNHRQSVSATTARWKERNKDRVAAHSKKNKKYHLAEN